MELEPKVWLSIENQIAKLKERGMLITDGDYPFVSDALMQYGYYEIINGYRNPFLVNGEHDNFKENTTFYDLYYLFEFDQELRDATLSAIELFELSLRQAIARVFSKYHTEDQQEYLNFSNYRSPRKGPYKLAKLIKTLSSIAYSNLDEPFKHYREQYKNVPPWIVVKGLDFGGLKIWYSMLKTPEKQEIVEDILDKDLVENLGIVESVKYFSSMLDLFHQFRNRAAHGGRIYNYFPKSNFFDNRSQEYQPIIQYREATHQYLKITPSMYREGFGQSGVWLLMKILISLDDKGIFNTLSVNFDGILQEYLFRNPNTKEQLQSEMLIPRNDTQFTQAYFTVLLNVVPEFMRYGITKAFTPFKFDNIFLYSEKLS